MATLGFKEVGKILSKGITKGSIQKEIAEQVVKGTVDSARGISRQAFAFDFIPLLTTILVIYAVAWFIDIYFKAKLFFADEVIRSSIIAGFFGLSGLLFNFFVPKNLPDATKLTDNEFINKLFSEEGFNGLRFWDIINVLVGIIIISTYFRHRNQVNGDVDPATTAGFIMLFIAVALVEIPSLVNRLKTTDFNIASMR